MKHELRRTERPLDFKVGQHKVPKQMVGFIVEQALGTGRRLFLLGHVLGSLHFRVCLRRLG